MNRFEPTFFPVDFEEKSVLDKINYIFRKFRKVEFQLPKRGGSVILLVSGGLDSTLLWYVLMKKYGLHVYPIHNKLGNRTMQYKALKFFENFYQKKIPLLFHKVHVINQPFHFRFNIKNVKKKGGELPFIVENSTYDKIGEKYFLSPAYNPVRLGFYSYIAYEYSLYLQSIDINVTTALIGYVANDLGVGREASISLLRSLNLSTSLLLGDWKWQFSAPIEKQNDFYYTKKGLITYAAKHKIPVGNTWSCNRDLPMPCGLCDDCRGRKILFTELQLKERSYLISKQFIYIAKKIKDKVREIFSIRIPPYIRKKPKVELKNKIFSIALSIDWYEQRKRLFIYNKSSKMITELNEFAITIWKILIKYEQISFYNLIQLLSKEYRVERKRLTNDLSIFLLRLVNDGFINLDSIKTPLSKKKM